MEPSDIFMTELLESGIQVVGQPMRGVESVAFGILVGSGARDEPAGQGGVSHFVERMLFRGTEHLDVRSLLGRLDALGISYDSSSGLEMSLVSGVMVSDKLSAAVDLLADVVRYPAFSRDAVPAVRTLMLQEIAQREDRLAQRVMESLRQQFYAGSPLANDPLGTPDSVEALTRDDLVAFWADRFTANNMIVSVAGKFEWQPLIEQLRRVTATWPQGRGRMVMHEPTPQPGVTVLQEDKRQENIAFAFPAVPVGDPHYYAAALLSQALGGSSNSRLYKEVRDKRGLAYAVQSRFDGLEKTGLIRVYVGTSAERAHESVEVILEELRKLEQTGITDDELRLAKTRLKSLLIMRSESTSARMVSNLRSWWFEERTYSLEEIKDLIDRVTVDEVLNLIQSLNIGHTLAAVALGPRSEDELFGAVLARG